MTLRYNGEVKAWDFRTGAWNLLWWFKKKSLCGTLKSLLPPGCPEAAEYFPFSIFEQTALFKMFRIWFKLHAGNTTHFPEVTTAVWVPTQNSKLLCKLESCFQMWATLENKVSLLSVSFIRTYALYRPQNSFWTSPFHHCNLKRPLNTICSKVSCVIICSYM